MKTKLPFIYLLCLTGMVNFAMAAQDANITNQSAPRKIISYGGGGWKDGQVNEPVILVNPKNSSRLIMFFSGMKLGGSAGAIGKAWADLSDPFTWHEDASNPLLANDPGIAFEAAGIRLDTVIYRQELDEYWFYYTGTPAGPQFDAIGLAICPAGKDGYSEIKTANIKRHAGNPILSPKGQGRDDETCVSQGAVVNEKGLWYSLYSYRTTSQTLPGIRLATSPDGKRWTKQPGPDLLVSAPESLYIEWHQIYRIDNRYVMFYEGYNGGTRWGADVAISTNLTVGWKKLPVSLIDQMKWSNYADSALYHVATPAVYQFNHKWHIYFQAAPSGSYSMQHWTLWGLECDDVMKSIISNP